MKQLRVRKIVLDKFIELFYQKRFTIKETADYFGVNCSSVSSFRRRYNLPVRGWANGHPMKGKHSVAWNKGKSHTKIAGKKNPNWNGGEYISHGYRMVMVKTGKYVREHRLIMEKHLGRTLDKDEIVHHINGDKLDNRIENLMIFDKKSHAFHHFPKGSKIGKNS